MSQLRVQTKEEKIKVINEMIQKVQCQVEDLIDKMPTVRNNWNILREAIIFAEETEIAMAIKNLQNQVKQRIIVPKQGVVNPQNLR